MMLCLCMTACGSECFVSDVLVLDAVCTIMSLSRAMQQVLSCCFFLLRSPFPPGAFAKGRRSYKRRSVSLASQSKTKDRRRKSLPLWRANVNERTDFGILSVCVYGKARLVLNLLLMYLRQKNRDVERTLASFSERWVQRSRVERERCRLPEHPSIGLSKSELGAPYVRRAIRIHRGRRVYRKVRCEAMCARQKWQC